MKKILATLCVFVCLLVPFTVVNAEEVEETVEETVEEISEEIEETSENALTEEQFTAKIQEYLSAYMSESLLQKVISWAIDAGVLGALFVVYVKYRKYKHNTTEEVLKAVKAEVGKHLNENFKDLSKTEIQSVISQMEAVQKSNETIMKVLVLMQDNTAKGKVALIDYLGSKTESEEVRTAVEEVNETLAEQEKAKQELNKKVKGNYEKIF